MLKKKMAAGIVALAMFSTLGLAACDSGGSGGGGSASGSIPAPDVACDVPAGNIDGSAIDTSKVEGEITFQTQGLQNDFGDFFKAKIKEFEDANPGVTINWTDQGGGAEFDQTITAQASNCKMADVVNVPSSTILALSKSNLLMDYDVKAPASATSSFRPFGTPPRWVRVTTTRPCLVLRPPTSPPYNKEGVQARRTR